MKTSVCLLCMWAWSWLAVFGMDLAQEVTDCRTAGGGRIEITGLCPVSENLHIPENVDLVISGKGRIDLAAGVVLTLDGMLAAPDRTIFSGAGRVTGSIRNASVLPQWFGARGDGVHNDAPAMQRAADLAAGARERRLVIPPGRYRLEDSLTLRCNVDCFGILLLPMTPDRAQAREFSGTYMTMYPPKKSSLISIVPDVTPLELEPTALGEIKAGDLQLSRYRDIPLLREPQKRITLENGGVLLVSGTDFFTSRMNMKGDEFYTPNDIVSLVSPQGDVFPEFCFNYRSGAEAIAPWNADTGYRRGDYCTVNGMLFKASYPSGPGSSFVHKFKGRAVIGSRSPLAGEKSELIYPDGSRDSIRLWVKVTRNVRYLPPQAPLTINNLQVETFLENAGEEYLPMYATVAVNSRSNVTFNRLRLAVTDRRMLLSTLLAVRECAGLVFNDCTFSGATFQGLGYNIMHNNVAQIVYNNCISLNARKGMAGRHGKNITVNGGFFNVIDDHYGVNYRIENVEFNALSVNVPGYCTPKIDLQKWHFTPSHALVFAGANISVRNCRIRNAASVFLNRADVGDLGGTITLRDVTVEGTRDFNLFSYRTLADFDYAHRVWTPARVVLDNVVSSGGGRATVRVDNYGDSVIPVQLTHCSPVGLIQLRGASLFAAFNLLDRTVFQREGGATLTLLENLTIGPLTGLEEKGGMQ